MAYPDRPVPLLILNENSEWEIPTEARSVLESIEDPITAISIVGKYRGGKSYLMNVIGGRPGFDIGATVQAQTKGIWMWPVEHPKEKGRCLLLLDTEGLHDVKKGDSNHDMQLFVYALLMSSCVIYNIKGALDQTFISELQMVTELTEKIQVRGGAKRDEEDEEQALKDHIPNLVVVVRDFHLALEDEGKPITPGEYLENVLVLKRGTSKSVTAFNMPRQCIRQYFQHRTCFTLPKPVQDDNKIQNLGKLPKEELQEEFIKKSEELVEYVLSNTATMTADNHPLFSQGYLAILKTYVDAVNENGVPCIESAVESMKRLERQRALTNASEIYIEGMKKSLKGNLPLATAELVRIHTGYKEQAVEKYRRIIRIEEEAAELYETIEAAFQSFSSENHQVSNDASLAAITECFAAIDETLGTEDYYKKGGHAAFKRDLEDAQSKYDAMPSLGPRKDSLLKDKMDYMNSVEVAIITSDKALSKKDKEVAQQQQQLEAQEAEAKRKQQELEEKSQEVERKRLEQQELFEKYKQDQDEKSKQEREQSQAQVQSLIDEMKAMKVNGLKEQEEQLKMQIKAVEEQRLRQEADHNDKKLEMEKMRVEMQQNHQEMMREMTRQHYERMERSNKEQSVPYRTNVHGREAPSADHQEMLREMTRQHYERMENAKREQPVEYRTIVQEKESSGGCRLM